MTEQIKTLTYFPEKFDPEFLLYRSDTKEFFTVGGTFDNPVFNKIGAGADHHKFTVEETWAALSGLSAEKLSTVVADTKGNTKVKLAIKVDDVDIFGVNINDINTRIVAPSSKLEVLSVLAYPVTGIVHIKAAVPVGASSSTGIAFSNDGLKLIITNTGGFLRQYTLSTPWDVATISALVTSIDVSSKENPISCIAVSDDGLKLYFSGITNENIHQYTMTAAFDLSTATFTDTFDPLLTDPHGITISKDGKHIYIVSPITIKQIDLGTAFDLTTASIIGTYDVSSLDTSCRGLKISSSGLTIILAGVQNDKLYQLNLEVAYDISTITNGDNISIITDTSQVEDVFFRDDGTQIFLMDGSGSQIEQYSMAAAFAGIAYASII